MERYLLVASSFCFLLSMAYTLVVLGSGNFRPGRMNLLMLTLGFALQSGYLYLRGQAVRSCPLHSFFDVLIFLSWAIVLFYLVIGTTYRLSLLGAFTAPLVFVLQMFALLVIGMPEAVPSPVRSAWVELHAALSVMAYGALGLAGVAGLMYLIQERQLKNRKFSNLLYSLPPITDLAVVNGRLILAGFGMLTIAFAAGLVDGIPVDHLKFWASLCLWVAYGLLLAFRQIGKMPSKKLAKLSVVIFVIALVTLPGIHYLSGSQPS
jgi:ABC-type uncharacterized transport system permease subunit